MHGFLQRYHQKENVLFGKELGVQVGHNTYLAQEHMKTLGGRINQASFHYRLRSAPEKHEALGEPLPVNEWVHLVGVWDGTKIYIYVNGELQNSANAVGQPWDSPEPVYIGADTGCNAGKGRCHFGGIIDEIVMFNVPLSEDDIKTLKNGIDGAFSVDTTGKITTTWGKLKASE